MVNFRFFDCFRLSTIGLKNRTPSSYLIQFLGSIVFEYRTDRSINFDDRTVRRLVTLRWWARQSQQRRSFEIRRWILNWFFTFEQFLHFKNKRKSESKRKWELIVAKTTRITGIRISRKTAMAVDVNNKISVLISSFLAMYKSCCN